MPARATRIFVLTHEATRAGLVVDAPSWWDREALFRTFAERKVSFPERGDVLFLEWTHLLTVDLATGGKRWALPEGEPVPEEARPRRRELLDRVQDVEWFIVDEERVWLVPERARPGCVVLPAPIWWSDTAHDDELDAWRRAFWKRFRDRRTFERADPCWEDEASLFLGSEIAGFDERLRGAYDARHRGEGWRVSAQHRELMRQFARTLREAVWVVVFDYEWESGLE